MKVGFYLVFVFWFKYSGEKKNPFISNNNMEISDSEFNSKKSSHFLYK